MNTEIDFHIPDCDEFRRGYIAYNEKEARAVVYFESLQLVQGNWGNPNLMAQGIQDLLRSWNPRYSNFDFLELLDFLNRNIFILEKFRFRNINNLSDKDFDEIIDLFKQLLHALKRKGDDKKSPVSVGKSLSLLATHFFPIWDSTIAWKYSCMFDADDAHCQYVKFSYKMKLLSDRVYHCFPDSDDRSLLKRVDEYNYSKYTMHWI